MNTRPSSLPCKALLAFAVLACLPFAAQAQAVIEWSTIATETPLGAPPQRSRIETMAHLAIHDALNAIKPRYASYDVIPGAPASASPGAAIATAAHHVLVAEAPVRPRWLDTAANLIAARRRVRGASPLLAKEQPRRSRRRILP